MGEILPVVFQGNAEERIPESVAGLFLIVPIPEMNKHMHPDRVYVLVSAVSLCLHVNIP